MDITDQQFELLIVRAMDDLPADYIGNLDNVAIVQADEPSDIQKQKMHIDGNSLLLGLYEGIPLTQRGNNYTFVLPDKITIFKNPLLAISRDENELYEHIKRTLWHEMAHFYGLSHADMDNRMKTSRDSV
ncbi:metallopeptidase family protein [Candidatus Saccharibacteria bacterium]|jgi:predicted Zn-dependent protease with MMP-like domain|nr:metallopeptidase family protein [Candidatus Saccharibacteria bacterium]